MSNFNVCVRHASSWYVGATGLFLLINMKMVDTQLLPTDILYSLILISCTERYS